LLARAGTIHFRHHYIEDAQISHPAENVKADLFHEQGCFNFLQQDNSLKVFQGCCHLLQAEFFYPS
jgi:hypothetical protein